MGYECGHTGNDRETSRGTDEKVTVLPASRNAIRDPASTKRTGGAGEKNCHTQDVRRMFSRHT